MNPLQLDTEGFAIVRVSLSLCGGAPKKGKGKDKGKGKGKKKKKKKKQEQEKEQEEEQRKDEFDAMTLEELKKMRSVLQSKVKHMQTQRTYFEFERDQLQKMFEITHKEVHNVDLQCNIIGAEMDNMQSTHGNNIEMYVQKVKHLEYDHENTMNAVCLEFNLLNEDQNNKEKENRKKQVYLQQMLDSEIDKQQQQHEHEIRNVQTMNAKECTKIKEEFEEKYHRLQMQYDAKLKHIEHDLMIKMKLAMHEIEERKNLHINDLMDNHECAFNKMRQYYNDITKDNLDLIYALKQEIKDLNARIALYDHKYHCIMQENKKLNEPLHKAQLQVSKYEKKLVNFDKDCKILKNSQMRVSHLNQSISSLRNTYHNMQSKYAQLTHKMQSLNEQFATVQHSLNAHSKSMRAKQCAQLQSLKQSISQNKALMQQIIDNNKLDPIAIASMHHDLNHVLKSKNNIIDTLRYQVHQISKAHDDLVRVYTAKLFHFGIPLHELQQQHIISANTTSVPAGFVAKQS